MLSPTLENLVETETLKWIFVGGKGGVGKTTTACALAIQLAKRRESVLILSTDPAHNLSDAFSQKFSNVPKKVHNFTNLYAMEIDTRVQETMDFKLEDEEDSGFFKLIPEFLSAFPGIDEALGFAELMNSVRKMNYSVIVFDTAPTGHTLRLISFPDLLEKGLSKLLTLREKMSGVFSVMSLMTGILNEDELHQKLDSLRALTTTVRSNFQNPIFTTFVCVCIPEFLSIYETERLIQELARHNMDASNIVVNQVLFPLNEADQLPLDVSLINTIQNQILTQREAELLGALKTAIRKIRLLENSFQSRRQMQSKYLREIVELYSDFHVVPLPLQPQEVRNLNALEHFSELLMTPRELPILPYCGSSSQHHT